MFQSSSRSKKVELKLYTLQFSLASFQNFLSLQSIFQNDLFALEESLRLSKSHLNFNGDDADIIDLFVVAFPFFKEFVNANALFFHVQIHNTRQQ